MNKSRILLVDDNKDLRQLVKYRLEEDKYHVFSTGDAESGLALARKHNPDLVVLDVVLPRMNGLEFCRTLRQASQTPIIFLSGKKKEVDKIVGLRLGADDYLTKPFSMEELTARIETILRRTNGRVQERKELHSSIGKIKVDLERHEVRIGEKPVNLTPKEFSVLTALLKADGRVLSRDILLKEVWSWPNGEELETRAVDELIARLRRKLKSERGRIVTVPNVGYKIKIE
jgi:two-component system, OmpR family, alkaline phosphatase synthesis response regulator PhoP